MSNEISSIDEGHLRRCVELATQALENGDDPFGSVLVDADGATLAEAAEPRAIRSRPDRASRIGAGEVGDRTPHA